MQLCVYFPRKDLVCDPFQYIPNWRNVVGEIASSMQMKQWNSGSKAKWPQFNYSNKNLFLRKTLLKNALYYSVIVMIMWNLSNFINKSIFFDSHRSWFIIFMRQSFFNQVYTFVTVHCFKQVLKPMRSFLSCFERHYFVSSSNGIPMPHQSGVRLSYGHHVTTKFSRRAWWVYHILSAGAPL